MVDAPSSGASPAGHSSAELGRFLETRRGTILDASMASLGRAHLHHYTVEGIEHARRRMEKLLDVTTQCVREMDVVLMLTHAESVARERFWSGYGLAEVQTAFNVLEETIWSRMLQELDAGDFARALGVVGTVLGMGKDALARTWVSLATRTRVPSLDLRTLLEGSGGN